MNLWWYWPLAALLAGLAGWLIERYTDSPKLTIYAINLLIGILAGYVARCLVERDFTRRDAQMCTILALALLTLILASLH